MQGSRSIVAMSVALGLLAGSAVAVAAQTAGVAPSPPTEFTGHLVCGPEVRHGTETSETLEVGDGSVTHTSSHGYTWQPYATEMSDPRLEGTYSGSIEWDEYQGAEGTTRIGATTWRIENEEGAWQGSHASAWLADSPDATASAVLIGEGAYEGLIALWEEVGHWDACSWDVRGLIIEGGPPAVPEPYVTEPAQAAFTELRVADVATLDERTVDLTIESPSVGEAKVRLLLPAGFDDDPEATYPVLYLLHGAWDDYTSWTRETDVEELTADLPLLVVMPDGGWEGFYSDWWNGGDGGPPAWETFHLEELRGILERDWRASDERVIAGLSMGGYGTMHYATAHPELFRAAAAFSGVLDPVGSDFSGSYLLWGDRVAQAENWAAHDPVAMAEALRGKPLYVSWGDGQPGPLDPPTTTTDSYELEAWVAPQNAAFVARLEELGIPVTVETGSGAHEWPYWEQGLHHALPMLLEALEQ
jgi:diacylglycerol O-acyltransferase/trehalose O-mycolyltransferase